jgi:protein TonB
MPAWLRFVSKNFHVPDEAINNNAAGTVIVQFVVDKEGNVSDVHAVEGPQELRAEAERVIKKSGKWTAAIQNGAKVNSYKRQPITVKFDE